MKSILSSITLSVSMLAAGHASAAATSPTLMLDCGIPNNRQVVTCHLSGAGFHSREPVQIIYRITFTALPLQYGKSPQTVYLRTASTDSRGRFVRPPLYFQVVKYHESFRMTVTAVGVSGDRASTTYVAIAQ